MSTAPENISHWQTRGLDPRSGKSPLAIGFLRTTETVLDLCMSDHISFPFRVTVFALKVHCVLKMESKSVNSYFGKQ